MGISREEAARVAELARLELPEGDLERVAQQLSQVLDFARTLDELDLEGCEPTVFAPSEAPLRADESDGRTFGADTATANAPESEHGFFLVPPVVENLEP